MSHEKPLYIPCMTAHSPQRLEIIVATEVAKMIVLNSVPLELKTIQEEPTHFTLLNCLKLDEVILGLPGYDELHVLIKERFKMMKNWWEKNHWFGGIGAPLRKLIQERVSYLLDHLDNYSHCPLFRFTCQLCFTREAGIFYQNNNEIIVQIPKRFCDQYADFVRHLGPFQIEHLLNTCMIFGNTSPLVTILKNTPYLRSIHLRYNSGDYTMSHVGRNCPNLEMLIVEGFFGKLCVSESFLYRTFFCGRSKEEVISEQTLQLNPVKISFPKLTRLDLGKSRMVQEFLCVLSFYYPGLKSFTCNSSNLVALYLLKASAHLGDQQVLFHIQDLCLTCECLFHLEDGALVKHFPKVNHVTLSFESFPLDQLDIIKSKSISFLTTCNVSSLTVHLPLEGAKSDHLEGILLPLFAVVGTSVKSLQFLLVQEINISLVWSLVNACPNLELLGFCLSMDAVLSTGNRPVCTLHPLVHLKSFSANFEKNEGSGEFFTQMEDILLKAPRVTNLELLSPTSAGVWVLNVAAKGLLNRVSTLILGLGTDLISDLDINLDVDFYVVVLEGLTALRTLVLIGVRPVVTGHLKRVYITTQLKIVPGRKRTCVAYHGLHARYGL